MRVLIVMLCLAALLGAQRQSGQRGGQRQKSSGKTSSPIVYPVFSGTVHLIDKKKIVLENDKGQETEFRRTGKTQFFQGDQKLKPESLKQGDLLQIEAKEDIDTSLIAINVYLQKKPAQ